MIVVECSVKQESMESFAWSSHQTPTYRSVGTHQNLLLSKVAAYLAQDGKHPHQLLQLLCTEFACCWLAGHCRALQIKQSPKVSAATWPDKRGHCRCSSHGTMQR
jgi:hypothetical protein